MVNRIGLAMRLTLLAICIAPIGMLLWTQSVDATASPSRTLLELFDRSALTRGLNSVMLALFASGLALVLAAPVYLFSLSLRPASRIWLWALSIIPLAYPPFGVAGAWMTLINMMDQGTGRLLWGATPGWGHWLHSLPGAAWVLALGFWPIVFLVWSFSGGPSRASLEAARVYMPPAQRLGSVWLPALLPATAAALTLTFCLGLLQFEAPALLQVEVFPLEIFIRFSALMNERDALALCLPYVLLAPVLIWALRRCLSLHPEAPGAEYSVHAPAWFNWTARVVGGVVILIATLVPLAALGRHAAGSSLLHEWSNLTPTAIRSVGYSATSALIALIVGLWFTSANLGRLQIAAAWIFFFLLLIPSMVVASAWLQARSLWPARYIPPAVSLSAMMIAYSVNFMMIGFSAGILLWRRYGIRTREAERLLPLRAWDRFRSLLLPGLGWASAPPLMLIAVLVWSDLAIAVMMHPPGGETLTLHYYSLLHYGSEPRTAAVGFLLLLIPTLALLAGVAGIYGVQRRREGFTHTL